jgi:hypothetical protein
MSISELIARVSTFNKVELGEREEQILSCIGDGLSTAYSIYSHIKKKEATLDYKNVTKRVRRLRDLKLITETKGESAHRARFYRLSSEGLFYLLSNCPIKRTWLFEYKDDIILRNLLYPYFGESTVLNVLDYDIPNYLKACCHLILDYLLMIRNLAHHPLIKTAEKMILRQLEVDLNWEAKILAFKLLTKKTDFWLVAEPFAWPMEYLQKQMKRNPDVLNNAEYEFAKKRALLESDKKFMTFSKSLGKEYEQSFSELVESVQRSNNNS